MNVLIIEQDKAQAWRLAGQVHARGAYAIDLATSSKDALDAVLHQRFDLILLGIHTEGMSNLEIVAMLRNMSPHAVIAALSDDPHLHLSSEVWGCVDVLLDVPLDDENIARLLTLTERIHAGLKAVQTLGTVLPTQD